MQSIAEQIVIGVVSGIVTAAVLALLGAAFLRIMLPWYRRVVYRGVDIEGTWEYRYDQPNDFGSMILRISQNAHDLSGDAAVTVRSPDGEFNLIYDVRGTLWEGYSSLILKSKDRRVVAFATLLLKVTNNGARLEGVYAFREPHTDRASSAAFFLERK